MTPLYRVIFTALAERSYRRLSRDVQRRILAKARSLVENPWPPGAVRLVGADAFRVRVGDYRILYSVERGRLLVLVLDVGHRREVYRRK